VEHYLRVGDSADTGKVITGTLARVSEEAFVLRAGEVAWHGGCACTCIDAGESIASRKGGSRGSSRGSGRGGCRDG
jgi:hypothetical protein